MCVLLQVRRRLKRRIVKIIDLSIMIRQKKDDANMEWFEQGFAELARLPEEQADKIVTFIVNYLLLEIQISIGLIDADPDVKNNQELFQFSERVNGFYSLAAEDWIKSMEE
jgi:hypothetical protein